MSMLMPTRRNRGLLSDFMFDPFDAFFNTPMPSASTPTLMRTDIKETESGFEMTIDLPGFKKEDVQAELKDGYLHIEAQTKSETEDKVLGLNVGADDYITKPFVPVEVLARVRSQLRRYAQLGSRPEEGSGSITIGGIVLDDRTKTVTVEGEPVSLTPTEYAILHLLMANPGKVFSTKVLYESVWQEAALGSEGAVAVHIRHLREKIEINPSEPRYLKVMWGRGYKLEGESK